MGKNIKYLTLKKLCYTGVCMTGKSRFQNRTDFKGHFETSVAINKDDILRGALIHLILKDHCRILKRFWVFASVEYEITMNNCEFSYNSSSNQLCTLKNSIE